MIVKPPYMVLSVTLTKVRRAGLTLLDLLVTMAIVGVLVSLFVPALQQVREAACRTTCGNNIRQLGLAVHQCQDVHGHLPPTFGEYAGLRGEWRKWKPPVFGGNPPTLISPGEYIGPTVYGSSLFAHLLPFIGHERLHHKALEYSQQYSEGPVNVPTWGDCHDEFYGVAISTYHCPSDPSPGVPFVAVGNYAANYQVFSWPLANSWQGATRLPTSVPDGLSCTIFFAERYNRCKAGGSLWSVGPYHEAFMATFGHQVMGPASRFQLQPDPWETVCDPALAQTPHPGGMLIGLGDGSARTLALALAGETWWAACTPASGDIVDSHWND